jgi:hypothetical protein
MISPIQTQRRHLLAELDPFRADREENALNKFRDQDGWGPRRPRKKTGDVWVIVGAVFGMVGGGFAGYQVNPVIALLGAIAGGVIGAFAGSGVASVARMRRKQKILRDRLSSRRKE